MSNAVRAVPPTRVAAWLLMLVGLWLVLKLGLLGALMAGLLVYVLTHVLAPVVGSRLRGDRARVIALALVAVAIIGVLTLAIVGLIAFFRHEAGGEQELLARLMGIIDASRAQLPLAVQPYLPEDLSELKQALSAWFAAHRGEISVVGAEAVQAAARLLVGMVLGAMIALYDELPMRQLGPLAQELVGRTSRLAQAFRRVVFAQLKISLLNTLFTAVFLVLILPLFGVRLPLAKTLIAVTFVAGLLPVVGNLISNTVIAIVALSVSMYVSIAALVYLVLIHKLEYFLNARIVGGEIRARAWELLLAMLVMEAAFGLPGLVAAPIYYAYVKRELVGQGLV